MRQVARSAGLVAALGLGGCAGLNPFALKTPGDCPPEPAVAARSAANTTALHFLGVDGFLVRRGPDAFMTGPLFSNPAVLEVAAQEVHSDHGLVDALMPDVKDVTAIFVGHSHYDHLLDVPYVADRHAQRATIYGSATARAIVHGYSPAIGARAVAVDAGAFSWAHPEQAPQWQAVKDAAGGATGLRFLAIESEHSPILELDKLLTFDTLFGLVRVRPPIEGERWTPWRGNVDRPLAELPRTAAAWVAGTVYAYLIDFLDAQGQPAYRVYFQDSAARFPLAAIPPLHDGKRVDLALLCVGGSQYVAGSPEDIMQNTRAHQFVLGHWEDFFVPRPAPLPKGGRATSVAYHELPTGHTPRFLDSVKRELGLWHKQGIKSGYCLPCPGSILYFNEAGDRIGPSTAFCRDG